MDQLKHYEGKAMPFDQLVRQMRAKPFNDLFGKGLSKSTILLMVVNLVLIAFILIVVIVKCMPKSLIRAY